MPVYEIASLISVVLFFVLSFLQVIMRQQVHQARFGNQEISPSDVRFSNSLLGQYGIWNLHKRAYKRSFLRSFFIAISLALLVCVMVAVGSFLIRREF